MRGLTMVALSVEFFADLTRKEPMMADAYSSPLMRAGMLVFVCMWLGGLAMRFIFKPSPTERIDPVMMPAYRQIRVVGLLRWLFGYLPTKGNVPVPSLLLQIPAILTLAVTLALSALWPDSRQAFWLPVVIYSLVGFISIRFVNWLWEKQQAAL